MKLRQRHPGRLDCFDRVLNALGVEDAAMFVHDGRELLSSRGGDDIAEAFDQARGRAGENPWIDPEQRRWYMHTLALGVQRRPALLYLVLRQAPNSPTVVDLLGELIEHHWHQVESIESLSLELGNRYEELNLLYGIDNALESATDKPLNDVIRDAMKHCVEFLDIDAAGVWAPAYGLAERAFATPLGSRDEHADEEFDRSLFRLIRGRPQSLVSNGGVGDAIAVDGVNQPHRVVAVPISQGLRPAAGVLTFKRNFSSGPFTNSDRKIAEVLAAEVTKTLDARFDSVTSLMNRETLEKFVFAGDTWGDRDTPIAVIYSDIDQFKLINEACGTEAGDRLLKLTARLLSKVAPPGAVLARAGADEFVILLANTAAGGARDLAVRTEALLSEQRFMDHEKSFQITASSGIAELDDQRDLSRALAEAELACRASKELGGARVRIYEQSDHVVLARHSEMRWATEIRAALEEERFELFGQAICHTHDPDGIPAHYEVLLRMFDEEATMVSPAIFIPAAERYGLIARLDRMVVSKALGVLSDCCARGADVRLTVNLSGASLGDEEFRGFARDALASARITHGSLSFEITETAAISNIAQAMSFIADMKEQGCRFLLDDFGAGMSSYAYLRQFPAEYVKIDGSFIKNIDSDAFNRSIVESINQICHAGGKRTVAEFVENDAILSVLQDIGVDCVQGYRLDRPEPLEMKLAARFMALRAAV